MSEYPTQEFLHDPEAGVVGDCWRACIAGLLGVPLSEVPHFARDFEETWWEESVAFADDMVPGALLVALDPEFPVYVDGKPRAVIASGPSPRGEFLHAILVSGADGTLIWDPHPSRAGLAGPIEEIYALTL